jgi:hypothetical protein
MYTDLRTLQIACLLGTSVCLGGCTKSSNAPKLSARTILLTGARWRLTSSVSVATVNGVTITVDHMPDIAACSKDNFMTFSATPSRTFTEDEGPTWCSYSTSQTYVAGEWEFTPDETILVFRPNTNLRSNRTIKSLTEKELVFVRESSVPTGPNASAPASGLDTFTAF